MESTQQSTTGNLTVPSIGSAHTKDIGNANSIEPSPPDAASLFVLDNPKPLDAASFPHQPRNGSKQPPATISNVQHLLTEYGIIVRYNVVRKKLSITVPGYAGTPDNADNVAIAHIISLASLNGLSTGQILSYVGTIGDRHQINPVANWITSKPWDGTDRLEAFYETLVHRDDYPQPLKAVLMYRWLISAVAAALKPSGFRARGVLTLQGPQSIGKTAWVNALVPDPILREHTVKLDHHLDAGNKDSLLTAIGHWIVEIGELDSSFKKDIARLKGFLTGDRDKVRRPYGRTDSEYPRRTVFCATVNDQAFLVDSTGNSRWWTIPVTKINYAHNIDMQQVFAQVAVDFHRDEPWWLTQAEEGCLETYNKSHRAISAIHERVLDALDLKRAKDDQLVAMTPTDLLRKMGIKNPSNSQSKECAAILRELLGDSKRINGQNKWRVPLAQGTGSSTASASDDARY
jgi:putative DNA primase/helicase